MADGDPTTLVVGLGNPILGDDGVGWRIAEAFDHRLAGDDALRRSVGPVEIDELAVGGLRLMERLVGYERVVVADASVDGQAPGTVWTRPIAEVDGRLAGHLDNAHDATLTAALSAGHALGARLPTSFIVVGVSVAPSNEFGTELTPPVAAAVPRAVDAIVEELARNERGVG